MGTISMDEIYDKENMSPINQRESLKSTERLTPSPAKRKPRSRSLGPGDLDAQHEGLKRLSPERNRRKSAFPKSVLPSKEEEAARKAARRKSLANRRVSFAPEATLHTWDVVEYMRDATTSTAASDERRESQGVQSPRPGDNDELELPLQASQEESPVKQKRRRSSAIPPMNFNNPDELLSSSPGNGNGSAGSADDSGEDENAEIDEDDDVYEDEEDTAMSLVSAEDTGEFTLHSEASEIMSDSSARLDAVLRQATVQATTQNIQLEDQGDMTMDMVTEGTAQFSPWGRAGVAMTPMAKNLMAVQEQENINPFSPAFRAHAGARRPSTIEEMDEDVSMDMTRAIGAILAQPAIRDSSLSFDDETMELTQAVGQIRDMAVPHSLPSIIEQRSPEQSPERPAKRRRTSEVASNIDDVLFAPIPEPEDVTEITEQDITMDMTMAIGGIKNERSPVRKSRRSSVARRRSVRKSVNLLEPTMEFTTAIGCIKPSAEDEMQPIEEANEDLEGRGMDLTTAIGSILPQESAETPSTPELEQEGPQTAPSTPTDQDRFKEVEDMAAKKLLTPIFEAQNQTPQSRTMRSSSKRKRLSSQGLMSPAKITLSPHRSQSNVDSLHTEYRRSDGSLATGPAQLQYHPEHVLEPAAEPVRPASPLAAPVVRPESAQIESNTLSDNLRILSTPRKNGNSASAKQAREMTPKRTPARATPRSTMTPRSMRSNTKAISRSRPAQSQIERDVDQLLEQHPNAEVAPLHTFVQATGLNFMDLRTNKRDLAATPSRARQGDQNDPHTVETAVVASTCSVPELSMYEHSCEQLTHFISEGKSFLRDLEQQVKRNETPLLRVYSLADAESKARFDEHIQVVRSKARNESKQIWYGWRSQLLENIEQNLQQSRASLELDNDLIAEKEALAAAFLPGAKQRDAILQQRVHQLEASAAAASSEEQERLRVMRARLAELNASVLERRTEVQTLRTGAAAKEQTLAQLQEAKAQSLSGLQAARKLNEKLRAVSLEEISTLAGHVASIERESGWTIDSVRGTSITMTHTDLQLFFDTAAFAASDASKQRASHNAEDRPISLVWVPTDDDNSPLPTERRFFLQLLQAHVQSLVQHQTRIKDLLTIISSTWASASALQETLRKVRIEHPVSVQILSDERLGVEISILLPRVQTKVCVDIEICAAVIGASVAGGSQSSNDTRTASVTTEVQVKGRVVYGEQYKESAIAAVVRKGVGSGLQGWEASVRELRERLIAFGRKA